MQVGPPDTLLVDANVLSIARLLKEGLPVLLGCSADRIVVPFTALDECLATTSATHPRRAEYLRLTAAIRLLDPSVPSVVQRAAELVQRYSRHGAALPDMLVAATALEHAMTLVSTNWSDFHFVHGLWLLDARYQRSPGVLQQAPPPTVGPVLPAPRCCKGLVDAGVLPRPPRQHN